MSLVYDIIFIAIVLLMIRRGWKRGFLSVLIMVLAWGLALFLFFNYADGWAEKLYYRFCEPWIMKKVSAAIPPGITAAMVSGSALVGTLQGVLGEYISKIYMETKSRPRYIISERTY